MSFVAPIVCAALAALNFFLATANFMVGGDPVTIGISVAAGGFCSVMAVVNAL